MKTAEEIAVGVVCGMDTMRQPYLWCVKRTAEFIRAARIEAVEEFRKRALAAVWDPPDGSVPLNYVIDHRISALPALLEEP